VPFALGVLASGREPGPGDAWLAVALSALFLARILLKDYRDRAGDASYGKPTLLLRFGSTATSAASLAALLLANVLLVVVVRPPLALAGTAALAARPERVVIGYKG